MPVGIRWTPLSALDGLRKTYEGYVGDLRVAQIIREFHSGKGTQYVLFLMDGRRAGGTFNKLYLAKAAAERDFNRKAKEGR